MFQERTPDGGYRREPADLLDRCAEGKLYAHLLDGYIGAAKAHLAVARKPVFHAP